MKKKTKITELDCETLLQLCKEGKLNREEIFKDNLFITEISRKKKSHYEIAFDYPIDLVFRTWRDNLLKTTFYRNGQKIKLNDTFTIDYKSFEEIKIYYNYIYFVFIDLENNDFIKNSKYENNLYYFIVMTSAEDLSQLDFNDQNAYSSYYVDSGQKLQPLALDQKKFDDLKYGYQSLGDEIRTAIEKEWKSGRRTESVRYGWQYFYQFIKKYPQGITIQLDLIIISDCPDSINDIVINDYLKKERNKHRISLAFSVNDDKKSISDHEDIATTHP